MTITVLHTCPSLLHNQIIFKDCGIQLSGSKYFWWWGRDERERLPQSGRLLNAAAEKKPKQKLRSRLTVSVTRTAEHSFCLLIKAIFYILCCSKWWVWVSAELQVRGIRCGIDCSWEIWFTAGGCPVAVTTQKFSSPASFLLLLHPQACMCVACLCLYVCLVCVCACLSLLSSSDGKCPGSSSSFGEKGNMSQMDTIRANKMGAAAQKKTCWHTYRKHECSLFCSYNFSHIGSSEIMLKYVYL